MLVCPIVYGAPASSLVVGGFGNAVVALAGACAGDFIDAAAGLQGEVGDDIFEQRFEVERLSFADVRCRSWNQELADSLAISRADGARESNAQRILYAMGARR